MPTSTHRVPPGARWLQPTPTDPRDEHARLQHRVATAEAHAHWLERDLAVVEHYRRAAEGEIARRDAARDRIYWERRQWL